MKHVYGDRMSILIVDGSMASRIITAGLLKEVGYADCDLTLCGSVEEAYQTIGINEPDRAETDLALILLDIDLPGESGFDACRSFSRHDVFCDVPIIMTIPVAQLESLDSAFSAGATDYIITPPNRTELLAKVRFALRLKTEMNRRKAREEDLMVLNERLAELNREVERLSLTDHLTGLANRRFFNELLNREWLREQRGQQPFSVIMVDIDHFKRYNDHYGHLEGDVCLQKVAWALQGALCRAADALARYDGEEFIAILPHTDMRGATELAAAFHARVRALGLPHGESPVSSSVTISIGIASVIPNQRLSPSQVVAMAEEALCRAKQAGRNQSKTAEPRAGTEKTLE